MARTRVIVPDTDLEGAGNGGDPDMDTPTHAELEQAAAGDIAMLGDPQFTDYEWSIFRQRTRAEIMANAGPAWEFWTKKVGPLDSTEMQIELGGGTFEFRGYFNNGDGNGKVIRRKPIITFAGPRKPSDPTPPPVAVTSQPVAPGTDPTLVQILADIRSRLDRIERAPVTPAAPPMGLKEMVETIAALDGLRRGSGSTPDPLETAQAFMGAIKQGIELGQAREPLPADVERGTDWPAIIEKTLPFLDRVLSARRQPQPPPRPAARPTVSHAEVVTDTPAPAAAPAEPAEPDMGRARMMTLIDSLARAISTGTEAADFAGTVADILDDAELAQILASPTEGVIGELTGLSSRYPVLGTDAARVYITAVLDELRSAPDEQ